MKSCVFDIETAALPDRDIPPALVEKLRETEGPDDWHQKLGFYALASVVIVIGMVDPKTGEGEVLYDDRYGKFDALRSPEGTTITPWGGAETGILERFWTKIVGYDRIVTYNGRFFDVPFLMQRSLIRGVPISCNLVTGRRPEHVDLAEILTLRRSTRMYGLAAWSQAIGLENPKEGGISGANVDQMFSMRRTREIAEYCLRDVQATSILGERVLGLWQPLLG